MNIQQLIAEGRTEEALELLSQQCSDALLLQARYNAEKKQYNMGMLEYNEWQRTQAQINYTALELSKKVVVNVDNSVHITTIVLTNTKSFKESIEQMDLKTLVSKITEEFKGKPAMTAWLPLKQDYDSYELLGKPFAPGYLTDLKAKLVNIYDEYWTSAEDLKNKQVKSAVQSIYESLTGKNDLETVVSEAITDLQVFFYENPEYVGIEHINKMEQELASPKMRLFKDKRPETYQSELERLKSEMIEILNRILHHVE